MKGITTAFLAVIIIVLIGIVIAAVLITGGFSKGLPLLPLFSPNNSETVNPFYVPRMTIESASASYDASGLTISMVVNSYSSSEEKVYINVSSLPASIFNEVSVKKLIQPENNIISISVPGVKPGAHTIKIELYTEGWLFITSTGIATY